MCPFRNHVCFGYILRNGVVCVKCLNCIVNNANVIMPGINDK